MAVEGTFVLTISGRSTTRAEGENIRGLINDRVKLIDPDIELNERNFAGLNFIYVWSGIPLYLDKAQMLLGYLKKTMTGRIVGWKFEIEMHLIESGGD